MAADLLRKISEISKIKRTKQISIYSLIDYEKARKGDTEEVIEDTIRRVYFLAGLGLIELSAVKSNDELETIIKLTERGESYIKYEPIETSRE